jgi:penicillin-binding protein 1A
VRSAVLALFGRASTRSRPRWLGPVLTRSAQLVAVLAVVLLAAFGWLALTLPVTGPPDPPRPSLLLESTDGRVFATRGAFRGAPVDLAALPPHLADAVLAIEDRRFRSHLGVDLRGIGRALVANLTAGGVREGGSTITQQLARLLYLSQERTLRRKLQEAMLAVWLELRLSKDEILERYLNGVYFGAGAYGVEGAARRYFRKPARELSLSEAAMLAGLIQAPSDYAPTRDLAVAQERASVVLGAMVDAGVLAQETADAARASPAVPVVEPEAVPGRAYFADWLAGEAGELLGPLSADYAVRTTLDLELQALAEQVIEAHLAAEGAEKRVSQAALVALGADGALLAMVGGRDYRESQFNRATQARRQPGSLFKLFVYLAAFEAGLTPDTVLVDEPVQVGDWQPENHSGRHMGPVELRTAFALSLNSIAVKLIQEVGPERVIEVARRLGIASPLEPNPSLALGTAGTTLLEITRAYAAVATGRLDVTPYGIAAVRGGEQVIDLRPRPVAEPAPPMPWRRELLDMLLATVRSGTGRAAALDRPSAGKTGTTQGYRDAWYVGFTADAVVGVWVGNDDASPTARVSGADLPARIWHDFMQQADHLKAAPPAQP